MFKLSKAKEKKIEECITREDRVSYCALEMAEGRWRGYLSRLDCRVAWECSDSTVRTIAAEASRLLRLDEDDRHALRIVGVANFLKTYEEAKLSINNITGQPDLAAANTALDKALRWAGLSDKAVEEVAAEPTTVRVVFGDEPEKAKSDAEETGGDS